MNVYELIKSRRTVRHFQPKPIPEDLLTRVVDTGRLAPCGANLQPLRFLVVTDTELKAKIFPSLKWAAYLRPDHDPAPGQEPAAYIIIMVDEKVESPIHRIDMGIAAQSMTITALAEGVASCMLLAFNPKVITDLFSLPDYIKPSLVLALGYPDEAPLSEDRSDTVKYYKNDDGVLTVPKRPLSEVMSVNEYKEG